MRAILISVHPHWIEEMGCGRKKVEVRKSRPKQSTPFKCYIYCTGGMELWGNGTGETWRGIDENECLTGIAEIEPNLCQYNHKVVGEFICDKIEKYPAEVIACAKFETNGGFVEQSKRYNKGACLTAEEMFEYSNGKPLYGWHISDLKIYDKPKELKFFHTKSCLDCPNYRLVDPFCDEDSGCDCFAEYHEENGCEFGLKRPPQSWCYVEALLD